MRSARGLVLALAVVAGGAAALIVHKAGTAKHAKPERPGDEMVDVLVAARAIGAGETVGAEDVRWQAWPKSAVVAGSIERRSGASGSAPAFDAAPARFPILAGEPIVEAKLTRSGRGSVLAMIVAPGKRAISVPVREETAAGGFIQPQDRVDIMLMRKGRDGRWSAQGPMSETVLRGIKVLAIGKELDGRGSGSSGQVRDARLNAQEMQVRTVTLELSPAEGQRLLAAQSAGELTLALVAASDGEPSEWEQAEAQEPEIPVTVKFGKRRAQDL